jgi:HK97 family phage major capsid protein
VINSDSTEALRVPFLNDVSQVGTIQGENVAATESDPTITGFETNVDQWNSGLITVGNPTIASSALNVQEFITEAISTRFLRYTNNNIITGNGSNIASLLTSAANVAGPTGTTSSLNLVSILDLFGALDAAFRTGSAWLCNTKTWVSLSGIVNTQGTPILTSDLQGNPFRLLMGHPILISEAMPSIGVSTQPLAYGNFYQGYTARYGNLVVRKSLDRYFEQNATAFAAWNVVGGYSTAVTGSPNPIQVLTTSAT